MRKLLLLVIVLFVVLSVYFNWFDSRELWNSISGTAEHTMDSLQEAGENVSDMVDHTLNTLNKGE